MTSQASFPADPSSPAAARHFVARILSHCPPQVRERAILMVSELASNAVQHAHSSFSVSIDETQDGIRVEVRDSGGGTPVVGAPTFRDVSGRGLLIVKSLSQEFGIDQTTAGKAVWFRLSTDSTAGPRRARSSGRQHDR